MSPGGTQGRQGGNLRARGPARAGGGAQGLVLPPDPGFWFNPCKEVRDVGWTLSSTKGFGFSMPATCGYKWEVSLGLTLDGDASCGGDGGACLPPLRVSCLQSPSSWPWPCVSLTTRMHTGVHTHTSPGTPRYIVSLQHIHASSVVFVPPRPPHMCVVFLHTETCPEALRAPGSLCPPAPISESELH